MDPEENIPSPYLETLATPSEEDQAFIKSIKEVCREHNNNHFFIAFTRDSLKPERKNWKGFSSGLSEEMVSYLEFTTRAMRLTWDKIKKKI